MNQSSNQTTASDAPKLAAPGAGLPWYEMLLIRLWFAPIKSRLTPPSQSRKRFEQVSKNLIELSQSISARERKIRVLIASLPGLEDSSRNWSIDETLEHLLIVSRGLENVILSLASGKIPPGVVSTAAVKPKGQEPDPLVEFKNYAPYLMAKLDEKLSQPGFNFNSQLKFRHPWFGPLKARQWYWLLASHLSLHYHQAQQIQLGLKRANQGSAPAAP